MPYVHAIERSPVTAALVTLFATAALLAAAVGPALA
jgi:hypothetical protein